METALQERGACRPCVRDAHSRSRAPLSPRADDVGADEERNRTRRAIRSLFTVRACWLGLAIMHAPDRTRSRPLPAAPALHDAVAAAHGQRGDPEARRCGANLQRKGAAAGAGCLAHPLTHPRHSQHDSELSTGFVDGIQQLRDTLMAEVRLLPGGCVRACKARIVLASIRLHPPLTRSHRSRPSPSTAARSTGRCSWTWFARTPTP